MRFLRLSLLVALIAGCQTIADVPPGAGKKEVVDGHTYDQVWDAAYRVAAKHLVVNEHDKAAGRILAEEPVSVWSYGAWVGLYITPPTPGARAYTVEVVSRKRVASDIGVEDWETKVLSDVRVALRPGGP
ncbi:MAG: hypothetical protein ACREKS_16605 [Candidatus Rokuibacteriota bacterium]